MTSPEEYAEIDALEAQAAAESTPGRSPTSWAPIDLAAIVHGIQTGQLAGPQPALLTRTDGPALLYPGEVHSIAGEPESGKGWIALHETARQLEHGNRTIYLDFEDSPTNIVGRLLALGVTHERIVTGLAYLQPETAPHPGALDNLLSEGPYTLAVLDGMTEAYALLGLDSYANQDVPKFLRELVKPIATTGTAVLLIDHVTKSKEGRGRFALGAGHKLAGIAVAYSVEVIDPPSRAHPGKVKVRIVKDRHGHVRAHATGDVIALATITPTNNGDQVAIELTPPDSNSKGTAGAGEYFRPTVLMERVSKYVEANPSVSQRTIRNDVAGKAAYLDTASNVLVEEGWMERVDAGRARLHKIVTPYREAADNGERVPASQPRPNASQDAPADHRVPASPPYKGDASRDAPQRTQRLAIYDDHRDAV